ncbi:MAG: hypothetical protein JY451_12360 [Erythrobacter sp.]|nr:MAG: hypothetical protein JY451_12360 [Erythrobacter sp.]
MSEPTLREDWKDLRENWHDPEYRLGFWKGFIPTFLIRFIFGIIGALFAIFLGGILVRFLIAAIELYL